MFTQSWLLTKSSSSDSLPSSSPHRVSPPAPAKAGGKEGICHQDYDRLRLRYRHRHRHRHCHRHCHRHRHRHRRRRHHHLHHHHHLFHHHYFCYVISILFFY